MAAQRLALAHLGLNHAISTADRGAPPPAGDPKK
jgi:hypothetical protein